MIERTHNLISPFLHCPHPPQTVEGRTALRQGMGVVLARRSQALHRTLCLLALAAALLLTPVLAMATDPVVEMPPMPGQAYHPAAQANSDQKQPELPPELKKIDEQIKHDASVLRGGGELHSPPADGGGQQHRQESAVGQPGEVTEGTGKPHETAGAGVVESPSSPAATSDGAGTGTGKGADQALQTAAPQAPADSSGKVATPQSPMPRDKDDDKDSHGGLIVFLVAAVAATLFLLRKYFRR